jgi:hypothetical protein
MFHRLGSENRLLNWTIFWHRGLWSNTTGKTSKVGQIIAQCGLAHCQAAFCCVKFVFSKQSFVVDSCWEASTQPSIFGVHLMSRCEIACNVSFDMLFWIVIHPESDRLRILMFSLENYSTILISFIYHLFYRTCPPFRTEFNMASTAPHAPLITPEGEFSSEFPSLIASSTKPHGDTYVLLFSNIVFVYLYLIAWSLTCSNRLGCHLVYLTVISMLSFINYYLEFSPVCLSSVSLILIALCRFWRKC